MDRRQVYAVAVIVVVAGSVVASLLLSVGYTRHVQQQADRRWCELLETLDQPTAPPTTERGRRVQEQIHRLRADLGCERKT